MKSIAQEFTLDVYRRKEEGLHWMRGNFTDNEAQYNFDYELDYDYDGSEKFWKVILYTVLLLDDDGRVCGCMSPEKKKDLKIEIAGALNSVGLDMDIHVANGE